MTDNRVLITTYGTSKGGRDYLLFVESGRATAADEALFLLCENSPGGRRVFGQAVGQYKRGGRIRTPEEYVGLVKEISSSCAELLNNVQISFAAVSIRGQMFWWTAGGGLTLLCVSSDRRVTRLDSEQGAGRLEPGGKLIAGWGEPLTRVDGGYESFTRPGRGGNGEAVVVVAELQPVFSAEQATSDKVGARKRGAVEYAKGKEGAQLDRSDSYRGWGKRPGGKQSAPVGAGSGPTKPWPGKLSPFAWISLVGAVAVILMLLVTVWPSSRKASSRGRESTPAPQESVAVQPARTSKAQETAKELALSLGWKKSFQAAVTSSPIVHDGKVFFGCRDGGVYCLDAGTGEQVWKFAGGTGIGASPAFSDNGIFIGGYNGRFWRIDAGTGQKVWEFKTGGKIVSSPRVASGSVLFGSYDRNLYCVSAKDGRSRWTYGTAGVVWSSPFVEKERVFFGSVDGTFYCLSLETGELVWKYRAAGAIYSSPAVSEGVVCFGSNARALHFIDASTGTELFRVETAREVRASPLIDGETAYGASDDGVLRRINVKERTVGWTFRAQRAIRSTPLVSEGIVYVTSYDGRLHALEASSGKELASFDTGAEVYSSPAVSGTRVYFGANNGNFYCLNVGTH